MMKECRGGAHSVLSAARTRDLACTTYLAVLSAAGRSPRTPIFWGVRAQNGWQASYYDGSDGPKPRALPLGLLAAPGRHGHLSEPCVRLVDMTSPSDLSKVSLMLVALTATQHTE